MEKAEGYQFRRYRLSKYHPCLIALVKEEIGEDGKTYLSGFNMTHSISAVLNRPSRFIKIINPNPHDDAECYLCIDPIRHKPLKHFTKPLSNWVLSKEDKPIIDKLVEEKLN